MKIKMKKALMFFLIGLILVMSVGLTACSDESIAASTVTCVDDLAGTTIGVQLGTTGDIYATDYIEEGSTVTEYTKAADAITALKQGKVECVILDEAPAEIYVENNSDLSILDEALTEEDYAICVSKDNPDLTESINEAIATLKANGILDKIIDNYIGDDTQGTYQYEADETVDRSNGTLVVATNATFEPYEYIEDGEVVGIDIDLMQAICDILGMELEIQNIEFDSIITSVESGKADVGIAGMTVTEDRLESIDFTDSYTTSKQVILVRNGTEEETSSLYTKIYNNFIKDDRYQYIITGLETTLLITFFAVIIGIIVGFLIGIIRTTCDNTGRFKLLNLILRAYLTVIRGTPTLIQVLIIYFVIFASYDISKVFVAIIAFGINSSAYIAEIVRAGINSVDKGQLEASRSMGFNYSQSMRYFILPQAVKNILPALGNEFIVLLKETSIVGYIGIVDLTRAGDYIRSRTFEAFFPLVTVAIIYLVVVMILSAGVRKMERRLNKDGR